MLIIQAHSIIPTEKDYVFSWDVLNEKSRHGKWELTSFTKYLQEICVPLVTPAHPATTSIGGKSQKGDVIILE